MSVKVKICGVTRCEDALAVAAAGADFVGLNFWPGSKRFVTHERAIEIVVALEGRIPIVGVFVDAARRAIERTIESVGLDLVQLHGSEPPEATRGFSRPVIKALRARARDDLVRLAAEYPVDYLLLDTDAPGIHGGSGTIFAWERAAGVAPGRLFLAGGLRPENVALAVRQVRPFAVDVASGVEVSPGIKDPARIEELVRHAHAA